MKYVPSTAALVLALSTSASAQLCHYDPADVDSFAQSIEASLVGQLPGTLCTGLFRYYSPSGQGVAIYLGGVGSSAINPDCFLPDAEAYALVQQAGSTDDVYSGYYVAVYSPHFIFDPLVFAYSVVPNCCLSPYDAGLNVGTLEAAGSTVPGSTILFEFDNAQSPNSWASLVASTTPTCIDLGIGALSIDPSSIVATLSMGLASAGPFPQPLPPSPALSGSRLFLQGILTDSSAADPIRLTNGLMLTFE